MPTDAKITIELPEGVSKEEILKEIENLIRLKKYEVDMSFNLLNDYDKKRALKIAEFVENEKILEKIKTIMLNIVWKILC